MKILKLACVFAVSMIISSITLAQKSVTRDKPLVDVDIGGSSGNYNGRTYTELNLGVNLNFTEWLTWRNSAFKRFGNSGEKDVTGLDSTLRLISTTPFTGGAFRIFGGAGYRFADPSDNNALVGEGGLGFSFGRFGLGAGAKYLKYDQTQKDDISYFFTVSGGTGFSF